MTNYNKFLDLIGRILLSLMFLLAGVNKVGQYEATQGYMEAMGVPGVLLPLVILLEIAGAIALIVGWQTRWAALALAVFTVLAAALFHANFEDQMQMILFMKNLAVAGGLLLVFVNGPGQISLDEKLKNS